MNKTYQSILILIVTISSMSVVYADIDEIVETETSGMYSIDNIFTCDSGVYGTLSLMYYEDLQYGVIILVENYETVYIQGFNDIDIMIESYNQLHEIIKTC